MKMNQVTRVLMMYNKLLNGERINKAIACFEAGITSRTFDRDIEELRIFLSESYSIREILYNRKDNSYFLSGNQNSLMPPEYSALLHQLLIDTKVLSDREYDEVSKSLTSVTDTSLSKLSVNYNTYLSRQRKPIIKIFSNLIYVINNRFKIRIFFYDKKISALEVIPIRIITENSHFFVFVKTEDREKNKICLSDIESFSIIKKLSEIEYARIKEV